MTHVELMRARRRRLVAEHRCFVCAEPMADDWKLSRCPSCRHRRNELDRNRKALRERLGL